MECFMRVFVNWSYNLIPKQNHTWISSDYNSCDIVVGINNSKSYNKPFVNWLYEPSSIIERHYLSLKNSNNRVATHLTQKQFNNQISIPPCFPSWISVEESRIYDKTKLISMIASTKNMCNGHSYRQQVASKNENILDLYGLNRPNQLNSKIDGLKDYMFSVAMENIISDTYYTEKILDCFLTGTIPIYWGTSKICDIFDKNGILFLNADGSIPEINKDVYMSKIDSVKNNFEIAKQYNYTSSDGIQFITEKL